MFSGCTSESNKQSLKGELGDGVINYAERASRSSIMYKLNERGGGARVALNHFRC